jgi:hypothetical protein
MQIVPLEAAHLFYLNAAILGWLLAAVQPKKQHPRHTYYLFLECSLFLFVPVPGLFVFLVGVEFLNPSVFPPSPVPGGSVSCLI